MGKFLNVEISAENQAQADKIMNALLKEKLVTGGQFIHAPARFRWQGKVVDMDYVTITSFTIDKHKDAIIEVASQASEESVPMLRFTEFYGNPKLLAWIEETVA